MAWFPADLEFAFQPLYSLHTGEAVAVEALAVPGEVAVGKILMRARAVGRLVEADVELAVRAVLAEAPHATLLPLHVNVTAVTVAMPGALDELLRALTRVARRPREIVLEIGAPFEDVGDEDLLSGMEQLRRLGFRLAFDGLGASDLSWNLLARAPAELAKIDRSLVHGAAGEVSTVAFLESLISFAARRDLRLVAGDVETDAQLAAVRRLGIRLVQGRLFADRRPSRATLPTAAPDVAPAFAVPRMQDMLRPTATVPATATCAEVRDALARPDTPGVVVGLDDRGCPEWMVERDRFLLAVTGPYGYALYAARPASRLADKPRTVPAELGALQLLSSVARGTYRPGEDTLVVIDDLGRYQGMVLVPEVVHALAALEVEQAAAVNPLTRLPGTDTVAGEIERRLATREPFVAAWLDVDAFKHVNDTAGVAVGDDLIRALGQALTELAGGLPKVRVAHVGGDDFLIVCGVGEITALADRMLEAQWRAGTMPVTVSLASLVCTAGAVGSYRDAAKLLAPLKKRAKAVRGSSWVNAWAGRQDGRVLRYGRTSHGTSRR
ncbi:MAG TPA: GGDEF domain-containing protein [Amycolatopsis sp.]|nr:GGDEF domain-containing protein [Amycolatopsis sp.]